ncbi:DUF411 domain-containing protein [Halomonas huangheensis]|uniref:Metal-binding protein n=1 Tax=Halomonas huangheensis TaxID=1178482 RepID=W1N479_9GAMM|nr:DUF411 domain-containing protein [Halomonas huangheensis]ALM51800.1 hypothetical protein AR456_05485 [Halomonas huangheensis]ERL50313.1 hypothetical protein BJB45_04050 [Halomonas huangheensis]
MNRYTYPLMLSATLMLGSATALAEMPEEATLYKHPQCGCCDEYASFLEEETGVDVTIVETVDLEPIKADAGVPHGLGACHTIEMGNYVIEGHVPLMALQKLFEERPDVDGVGLAGMPVGTPGMPGEQQAPYEVYTFTDGKGTPFMTL